jgi:hypothetical protein
VNITKQVEEARMARDTPKRRALLLALAIGAIPFSHAIAQSKTPRLVLYLHCQKFKEQAFEIAFLDPIKPQRP